MEIKLDETKIDGVLHKAILEVIGKSGQELIIKQVVNHLTKEQNDYRGKRTTPIKQALNEAAEKVAQTVVKGKLENDTEFVTNIENLLTEAIKRFFEMETREKIINKLVDKMGEAFFRSDW